jgi:hypothetical protein
MKPEQHSDIEQNAKNLLDVEPESDSSPEENSAELIQPRYARVVEKAKRLVEE